MPKCGLHDLSMCSMPVSIISANLNTPPNSTDESAPPPFLDTPILLPTPTLLDSAGAPIPPPAALALVLAVTPAALALVLTVAAAGAKLTCLCEMCPIGMNPPSPTTPSKHLSIPSCEQSFKINSTCRPPVSSWN